MRIAVGRRLAALADARTAKTMGPQVTSNVAVGEEEVVATGRRIAALAGALIAKTMDQLVTTSVAEAEEEAAEPLQRPGIGIVVVVAAAKELLVQIQEVANNSGQETHVHPTVPQ